jgi:hypothetical protein
MYPYDGTGGGNEYKEITCTICLEIIVGCRKAGCGHIFCQMCIEEWLLRKKVSIIIEYTNT